MPIVYPRFPFTLTAYDPCHGRVSMSASLTLEQISAARKVAYDAFAAMVEYEQIARRRRLQREPAAASRQRAASVPPFVPCEDC